MLRCGAERSGMEREERRGEEAGAIGGGNDVLECELVTREFVQAAAGLAERVGGSRSRGEHAMSARVPR